MRKFLFAAIVFTAVPLVALAAESTKLPYAAGERFIVTTGYETPPTHIKKDGYAIDFTQDGCDAYGKPAVAAFSGVAQVVQENGYNGGYGTQLLVLSGGNMVARYAHLIPGSIPVDQGDAVPQGTIIGEIGDTGLVAGNACAEHPGTHIHFAMDKENADGSFTAEDPEPISGYVGVTAGRWYISDNALAATTGNLADLLEMLNSLLGIGGTVADPSNLTAPVVATSSNEQTSVPVSRGTPIPDVASASVPISPRAPVPSLAANTLQTSSPQSSAAAGSASTIVATSSTATAPSGGVAVGPSTLPAPIVSAPVLPSDDPSNDSAPACE